MRSSRRARPYGAAALLAVLFVAGPSSAGAERLPLWRIDSSSNTVYLLGSVHLLRESDYPIPQRIYAAYDDVDTLVMELDMDDLDPLTVQATIRELGILAGDATMADALGPEDYATATRLAAAADVSLDALQRAEPWYAAIVVEQQVLARLGYDASFGIEAHLAARAGRDGKEILGLETMRQQLELLDGLSPDAQRSLLLLSLEEALELDARMQGMVRAWRHGDTAYLEDEILEDMRRHAELYRSLVVTRNRSWAVQIDTLLDDSDDYLVVIGALHLVGADSVPALLEARGRRPRQLHAADDP